MKKTFNIIISGVGGQGLITLTQIIAEAAVIEGYDVKTSELHGLSQRGGSIRTHIRFGDKVYSPLISSGRADLILGLEITELLRNLDYANPKTIVLANEYQLFCPGSLKADEVVRKIKLLFRGKKHFVPASEICEKELNKEVVSGIYLLSYASHKKLIPLKPISILKAISNTVPKKYLDLNKKAFNLARSL